MYLGMLKPTLKEWVGGGSVHVLIVGATRRHACIDAAMDGSLTRKERNLA